jgi:hypothetical protein
LSDIIKSYYPHLTNIEITIKSDIEIKLWYLIVIMLIS